MRVLYLSAWYPTEQDKMAGLFVQKHAEAVTAQGADVRVLYSEARGWRYWRTMWQQWRTLVQSGWWPDVVQLNVITKNALIALWLKKRYNIPYIIVEHWTGYLPVNFRFTGLLRKYIVRHTAHLASRIMPVTEDLAQAMRACGLEGVYEVTHNVVDDFFYKSQTNRLRSDDRQTSRLRSKTILHISCMMEEHKNVFGLLRATKALWEQRQDFRLVIIGDGVDFQKTTAYATQIGLGIETVQFIGEKTPQEVCDWFNRSDFFVLNSNFENAPVVISEALAVGCPIISTDVGGIREMMSASCGILIKPRDEAALLTAMNKMLDTYQDYDSAVICSFGQIYSYEAVGKQLMQAYEQAISNK